MNPRYLNAVDQIYHSGWAVARLARQRRLREAVGRLWPRGHPTRLVQVGGTSGKGSVSRFLEAGFGLVGAAGSFTGPHLFDFRERFRVAGALPSPDDVAAAWEEVALPLCLEQAARGEEPFSFFEINILLALTLFERAGVAWAAIEVGVGGRYDRTSALDYAACCLTNVGHDHEELLGSEPWQRALDKAGVARRDVPLFSTERDPAIQLVIAAVCAQAGAPLHLVGEDAADALPGLLGAPIAPDSILAARHQLWNASLALAALAHLLPGLDQRAALERMAAVEIPGRLSLAAPGVYADVAHNPDKVAVLAREVALRLPGRPLIFVVGVSGERRAAAVLGPLVPLAAGIVVTRSAFKGQEPEAIRRELATLHPSAPVVAIDDARAALDHARAICPPDGAVILTGSTYMIDQALNPDPYLRHLNATYGWRERG
jgi:dihydrofolate synthase/folylpolyglutamate synthase